MLIYESQLKKIFGKKLELFPPVLNGGIFITKEYNMKKIVRLTESDLTRIVRGVISESRMGPRDIIKKLEKSVMLEDWDLVEEVIEHLKEYEPKKEIRTTDDVNSMVMGLVNSHYR